MAGIYQISMSFDAEQDRILLRLKTSDFSEIRLWLTRRYVKLLWSLLVKLLSDGLQASLTTAEATPDVQEAMLAFRHQDAVSKANYQDEYSEQVTNTPLGEEPVLVSRIGAKKSDTGHSVLSMRPGEGQGVDLSMDENLLHSFVKLLLDTLTKTDWDLTFQLPGSAAWMDVPADVVLN